VTTRGTGPNVGDGVVKITVDGDGINEDIVAQVEKAGPGVEKAGEDHGNRYSEGFDSTSNDRMDRISDNVGKGWKTRMEEAGNESGIGFSREFKSALDSNNSNSFVDRLLAGISDTLGNRLELIVANAMTDVENMLDRAKVSGNSIGSGVSSSRQFPSRNPDDALLERAATANAKYDADHLASLEKADAYGRQWLSMLDSAQRMNAKFDADRDLADRKWLGTLDLAARMNAKFDADRLRAAEQLTKKNNGAQAGGIGGSISGIGATLFGAGIFNALFQGLGGAVTAVEKLTGALSAAGGGGDNAFTKIIHGAAGGAVAVGALTTVLSLLITTVSGLGGAITAMVATITSGLTGALIVAGASMAAFAVSAGLVVTAFVSLDNAQKKVLKANFMPLRDEFKGIGQVLDQSLLPATKTWSKNLTDALVLTEPLVRRMGPALAEAGDAFTKAFSGKGFQQLDTSLSSLLPIITVTFSNALGKFANAFAGIFASLMPFVRDFGFYLDDIATKFAKWATSASGHNAIVDFTDRALVSLKSLWGFVTQFGGLLSDVLFSPSGQKAGNSIFDGLSSAIDNFRRRIAGGEMEAWFARAKTFAQSLGETLGALGGFFHALVSDGSMQIIVGILETLSTILQILTPAIKVIVSALGPLVALFQQFAAVLQVLPGPVQAMVGGIGLATIAFLKFGPAVKAAAVAMAEMNSIQLMGAAASFGSFATKAIGVGVAIGGLALATHKGASDLAIIGGAAAAAGGAFLALGGPASPVAYAAAAVTFMGTTLFGFEKRAADAKKALDDFNASLNSAKAGQMAQAFSALADKTVGVAAAMNTLKAGGKLSFDQIVSVSAAATELNNELPQLRQTLIQQAGQLGINTDGWDQLTFAQARARAGAVDLAAAMQQMGFQTDTAGAMLNNLHNYLLIVRDQLNLSNSDFQALLNTADNNLTPTALVNINNELAKTGGFAYAAQQELNSLVGTLSGVIPGLADLSKALPNAPKIDAGKILKEIHAGGGGGGVGYLAPPPSAYGTQKAPGAGQYQNPYAGYANALLAQGPSVAAQIKNAILSQNKQIAQALASISKAASGGDVATQINTLTQNIATSAAQLVNTAQSALSSAAQSLASASSAKAAAAALAKVKGAQRDLAAALKAQKTLNLEIAALNKQKVTMAWVNTLLKPLGDTSNQSPDQILSQYAHVLDVLKKYNGSLADYANARQSIAAALTVANQKLAAAISLRDQYSTSVSDAVKSFASLITAQAQTVNGIAQALTATDITTNLQAKLTQIQTFQKNLKILLAEGLSNDAYKQIVDAGVDQGGAYAQALVNGGVGAVSQTNGLVGQINTIAGQLGVETSNRLYQAGVDAAQGLVDGLTSMSKQLDTAATALGNAIAAAVKKSLGIHSPSTVMIDMMDHVGDGGVIGLNNQKAKIDNAASNLFGRIAPSKEVAAYAASRQQPATVSGNSGPHVEINVETSTADPVAVAHEVVNEIVGRL
jgi:hypothetical protein